MAMYVMPGGLESLGSEGRGWEVGWFLYDMRMDLGSRE